MIVIISPIYLNDTGNGGTLLRLNTGRRKDAFGAGTDLADPCSPGTTNPHNLKENTTMPTPKKVASLAVFGVLLTSQSLLAQEPNSSQSLGIPATQVKYKDL